MSVHPAQMKVILVTGANKGIGFALVRQCLQNHADTFLLLGSRQKSNGDEAIASLVEENVGWESRLKLIIIDTSSDSSVNEASRFVEKWLNSKHHKELLNGSNKLYAIVNNAGIGFGSNKDILNVNYRGVVRVDTAFALDKKLLDESHGRVVYVSSGAAVRCVQNSNAKYKTILLNPNIETDQLDEICRTAEGFDESGGKKPFQNEGIGMMIGEVADPAYGLSKALLNSYMVFMARTHGKKFKINSCSPGGFVGFVSTVAQQCQINLSRGHLLNSFKIRCVGFVLAKWIATTPDKAIKSCMKLLFEELDGNGKFYHKNGQVRPLDKY